MNEKPREVLRRAASQRQTLAIPGAPHALAARLIERCGFPAAYLSGAAFSAGTLGLPDVGLFTLSELAEATGKLTRATSLPLVVDADTGFGGTVNVARTIVELETQGAAAIQLEDQQLPKRCGHLSGKTLVSVEEMCAKLRAATAARRDPDLVLLARTDARASSFDEAVGRARAYLAAGADWIFPEALQSAEEFAEFAQRVEAPLVANMTEFGKSPLLSVDDLRRLGYVGVLFPVTLLRIAMKAVGEALEVLARDGTQRELLSQMQTREELYELLDYRDFEERDRTFFRGA